MTVEIKVCGEKAKHIKERQVFTPSIKSVEGRTVVTLKSKEELMVITNQQVKWLHRAAGICRGSYENASYIQSWIIDILGGKDMSEEFADYE